MVISKGIKSSSKYVAEKFAHITICICFFQYVNQQNFQCGLNQQQGSPICFFDFPASTIEEMFQEQPETKCLTALVYPNLF